MIILDTDHISVLKYSGHARCIRFNEALRAAVANDVLATTIVSAEEQMRRWFAEIHRERDSYLPIQHYLELGGILKFFSKWRVEYFDAQAVGEFLRLRQLRVRIGSQDLKIAAIALSRDALLLSANLRDFQRVPGLRVESWID